MPQTYGYARVSTDGQTLDAQVAQLRAAGAERVFQEKVSGAKQERAQLQKLLLQLEPGDVLLVTRLDRLARSTRDSASYAFPSSTSGPTARSSWRPIGSPLPRTDRGSATPC